MKCKMAAILQIFVYKFGSSRAKYSNVLSFPPEIDIPYTPDLSILCFDIILDDKSYMAARP